jgi:hypothetical protein
VEEDIVADGASSNTFNTLVARIFQLSRSTYISILTFAVCPEPRAKFGHVLVQSLLKINTT